MAKAKALTTSIARQGKEERRATPTAVFAEDCNRLREAVRELYPELEGLLPPLIATFRDTVGSYYSGHSYSEIDAFMEQLYQLLDEQDDE